MRICAVLSPGPTEAMSPLLSPYVGPANLLRGRYRKARCFQERGLRNTARASQRQGSIVSHRFHCTGSAHCWENAFLILDVVLNIVTTENQRGFGGLYVLRVRMTTNCSSESAGREAARGEVGAGWGSIGGTWSVSENSRFRKLVNRKSPGLRFLGVF